jgi:hypothetical protein
MAVKDHVITENVMLDAKLNLLVYDTKLTLDTNSSAVEIALQKFFNFIFLFLQTLTLTLWKGSRVSILGILHTKICMYDVHTT